MTARPQPSSSDDQGFDYAQTLFLPRTEFPMRAGLPAKEPAILERWQRTDLYGRLRASAAGLPKFVLHDGPPYANGHIHIGHALNKVLKDLVSRSQGMLGHDANYVPGWDCHGLPIEWKIEEEYRAKGRNKDEVPVVEFRQECRAFAAGWLDVQREEFKRLGVQGDWDHPYTTMAYPAEATIAREIMAFAATSQLYRGSKPVMWSVVERTALAEAEVEYHDLTSDMVWVAFPVLPGAPHALEGASVVIWTTTPWTMPGNRAISYSHRIAYGLYEVTAAPEGNWAKAGARYVLADRLAAEVMKAAKVEGYERLDTVPAGTLATLVCAHPLRGMGYTFPVPLLDGDHVTDDAGTGFVHTAPSHGREDYDIWLKSTRLLRERGIDTAIPYTVDGDGFYTDQATGFGPSGGQPAQVITQDGKAGDANARVIKALVEAHALVARGRLKHSYPHSWRSKKPVIFRNTPQWFIAMDTPLDDGRTLRVRALQGIEATEWVPPAGENRITGMISNRPDWVVSRQRAWGVPIAVFVREKPDGSAEILVDEAVNARILAAFEAEGADAWYQEGAAARFLGNDYDPAEWRKVDDILDVWFDSGSTHAFTLGDPERFPGLAGIHRIVDGGRDRVMYLEGSDQHRGWFHSSLLESCGTRGRAPFDIVLTHGFTLDSHGQKMSKSLGNTVAPQDVIARSGADILRLWVASADVADDQRIGPEILKTVEDTYRKLRNTLRWMLGTLAHFEPGETVQPEMPELERLMLHRLHEVGTTVRAAYEAYDYKRVVATLAAFMTGDLSAFYFDIRKDALYCDPFSSERRRAALSTVNHIFRCVSVWLAPVLCFTAEEAWTSLYGEDTSVHLERFPELPDAWRDEALAGRWESVRRVRRVVTGALERERAGKRLGSSLEAAPVVHVADPGLIESLRGIDLAEVCITSDLVLTPADAPGGAFRLDGVEGVAVEPLRASGSKCARSWKLFDPATADPDYPDITPRDAAAMREWRSRQAAQAA